MSDKPVVKIKAKLINPKTNPEKESTNKNEENNRESFNIKRPSNANTKLTKIQEKNINGNYGRIYIQEDQKNKPIYTKKYEKRPVDENKLRGNQNNPKIYQKVNNDNLKSYKNKRYANSVDKNSINKKKEEEEKASHLRRKSIDRGGDYNNIQVTHVIYSTRDIDFHIIDPLVVLTEENKKKYRGSVDKYNKNGKNRNVIVTTRCSCDNIKIVPKEKKKNIGKTEVVTHRENKHLEKINNNNNNNNNKVNNKVNSYTEISKKRYSRPVNKNQRK